MKHCPQCSTGYPDSHTTCPTHGIALNEILDLKPGMVIHHSYRIIRKLGQGGMGAVYLAQHTLMDEPRALKFLSSELSHDQAFTGRFLREVRTLRQIRHRNVVDCGDLEAAEDGSLFFSMEFVDGPDLRTFLRDAPQPFDVSLALSITRGIAEGLGAAHARGMVHRDIKPENILMARDGDHWLPKIADFGIVATKESSTAFTRTGGTLLTVAYAASEQWRGTPAAQLDGRTDLYALGGVLYEMLTGQTPFHAESYEGWSRQHQTTPPPPPSTLRPELAKWQGLDALVLRLHAKDRNDRPKDVAEVLGMMDAVRSVPSETQRETKLEEAENRATRLIQGIGFKRVPRWVWITSVSVVVLAILIAGLAFGLPVKTIAKRADDLDKVQRYNIGGVLRNLACTRGDGKACVVLAEMYGVAKDFPHMVEFLSKACEAEDASSCSDLGHMYEYGNYFPPNTARASALYSRELALVSKACDSGDSDNCFRLGEMYHYGNDGVEKNSLRATALYSYACDANNADSCLRLAEIYFYGEGVTQDLPRAAELYSSACYAGQGDGCVKLARRYYQYGENGVAKDASEAEQLYEKACSINIYYCGRTE